MENLKLFFRLYVSPASTMSDIIDRGSWVFGAVAVLVVSAAFYASVNMKLAEAYRVKSFQEFYSVDNEPTDAPDAEQRFNKAVADYQKEMAARPRVPFVGDAFFYFFSVEPSKFYQPLFLISLFYVPVAILLMSLFSDIGNFGIIIRRDYGTLAVCTLYGWAAAHLPFAILGLALSNVQVAPSAWLAIWAASGVVFGLLMVFALRTVFGAGYGVALLVVLLAWPSMSLGLYVFKYVSPWLFSPFLIFFLLLHFGGALGGEMRGFGNALRQKQNLKRFLHNATVNPRDADAHVQLGLIYLERRQDGKALHHLERALEIDPQEIDANYEMGKLARAKGDLQKALDHFGIVIVQNEKHALNEVWREVGATYLAANMFAEARDALEKFVDRRSGDPEGLYYLGKVLKAQGETERAHDILTSCIEYAKASPDFRRARLRHWSKLAQKEL